MSLSSTAPSFSGDAAFVSHGVVAVHGDHVAVDDPTFLFSGAFERHGNDLWISRAFETRVVESYFDHGAEPLPLVAADGHWLPGRTVLAFTQGDHGPRYASNTAPDAPAAIGRVEGVDGNATAVRNGTVVLLHAGDFVYKGDAVATDAHGALAITFIDGTAFNLSAESKMVLDEMVYAPGGTGNKSLLSLVQGSINFVAGDVAHTGDMKVDTPVATMGIRGTAVHVEIGADNGPTHFSVMQEPNGRVGRYILYDRHDATKVLGSVGDGGMAYDLRYVGGHVVVEPAIKNAVELQHEHDFTKAVFTSFQAGAAHPLLRQLHEGPHVPIHATTHGSAAQTVTRPSSGDALSQPKPGSPTLGSDHDDRGSPTSSHGAQHHGAAHDAAGFSALIDVGASDVSVIPTLATLALVSMADAISSVRAVPAHPVPVTIMAPVPTPVETTTAPTPPATEPSTASTPVPVEPSTASTPAPMETTTASTPAAVETSTTSTPAAAGTSTISTPTPVETSTAPTPVAVETSTAPTPASGETSTGPTPASGETSTAPTSTPVETSTTSTPAPVETSTVPTPAPAETSTAPTLASGETGTAKIPAAVNEVLHVKAGSILSSAAATVLINGHENLTAIVSAASGSIVSPVSANGTSIAGQHGTLIVTDAGTFAYAAASGSGLPAHASAADSFTFTVTGSGGASSTGSLTIVVDSLDQAPSIAYTAASVTEAGATGLASATAHATLADPDGDAVTVSTAGWTQGSAGGWTKSGTYGTATLHTATGDVSYALDAGRPGPAHGTSAVDSFAVTVGDGFGATTSGTASFTVGGVDRAPSIAYTAASVTEAGATGLASATAHATLADPDGDAVTVSAAGWTKTGSSWTTVGLYGVATLDTATGNVAYTLDPTKQGPAHGTLTSDKFAVVAVDALGAMVTGNAVFTVAGADRAPSLSYTSATVVEPGATGVASATAHALPADADGDALTFGTVGWTHHANGTWTEAGLYGTATLNTATGDVSYVLDPAKASPAHGANASDSFTVIVADGYGATASGSATFHVVGADRAPTIGFTAASVTEAGATGVATATAHATLSDPDHDAVAVSTVGWTQTNSGWIQAGLYGTATLNTATGDVSYVLDPTKAGPAHGASATDGFAETVSDGQGATSIGTASFSVNGTDHAPTIGYTAATVTDGGASSAIAHATPGDVDGDAVVISTIGWTHNADGTWTQSGTYGTATLNTTSGDVSYALDPGKTGPASGTSGLESFAVAVNDGYGASATGLASFTVAAAAQNNPISGFTIGAQPLGNGQSVDVTLSGQFALPVANGLVTWDNGNDGHFVFTGVGGNFSTDEVLGAGNHVAVLTLSDPLHTMTATETVDINIGGSGNLVSSSTGGQSLLVGTRDGHAQTFVGSNQADTLLVLSGSNTLTGGGGGDTFVFATGNASGGFGNNEVTDFHASSANGAQDNIDLTAFHIANFNSLMSQATDHAAGVTLQLNGGSITLDHVAKASLHPELFHL